MDTAQVHIGQQSLAEDGKDIQKVIVEEREDLDKLLAVEAWDVKEWDEAHNSDFIKVYKRKSEDSPIFMIKAYARLDNIPPEKAYRMLADIELRRQWDYLLTDIEAFDRLTPEIDHMYSVLNPPLPIISKRDFCQLRTMVQGYKDTAFIIHFRSVEHPTRPEIKDYIRANTIISGYIFRPLAGGTGCTMTIATQADPKVFPGQFRVSYQSFS